MTLTFIQHLLENQGIKTETKKVPVGSRPKGIGWSLKQAGEQTGKDYSVYERKYKIVPDTNKK